MKNLQIEEIYELYSQTAGVCTDTRNILSGGMFFALKGENFNGNCFAAGAIEQGAAYAVIDDEALYEGLKKVIECPEILKKLKNNIMNSDYGNVHEIKAFDELVRDLI